jgi:hypothetical protein
VAKPGLERHQDVDEQRQPLTTGDIERAGHATRRDYRDRRPIVDFERHRRIPGHERMGQHHSADKVGQFGIGIRGGASTTRWFAEGFQQQDHRLVGSAQAAGSFLAPAASLAFDSSP